MVTIKNTESKTTPAKKTFTFKDIILSEMKFVDETGDITSEVLNAFPEDINTVDFKITIELGGDSSDL